MMFIGLFYHWIALKLVQIVMFIYETIFISIAHCLRCNSCIITIIIILAASTTYMAYKIASFPTKSIKFNSINVNLTVYNVILLVSNVTYIYLVTQILCSKNLDIILFCVSTECTMVVPYLIKNNGYFT